MKSINNYEGLYSIDREGNVKSHKRKRLCGRLYPEKIMKQTLSGNGYYNLQLCKDGLIKGHTIHRLLAETFIPNPENKPQVNHKNGVRTDNRLVNLEWVTASENQKHAVDVLGKTPWNKGDRKRDNRKCFCGNEFYPQKVTSKFCSKSCGAKNRYSNIY